MPKKIKPELEMHSYNVRSRRKHQESADCWCAPRVAIKTKTMVGYFHNGSKTDYRTFCVNHKTGEREELNDT